MLPDQVADDGATIQQLVSAVVGKDDGIPLAQINAAKIHFDFIFDAASASQNGVLV